MFDAQLRFAKSLAKKKVITSKQLPMKHAVDLPLSSEMVDWLSTALTGTGADGMLNDEVGSVLIQPLDSMSVYCPVGAMMVSQHAAARSTAVTKSNHSWQEFVDDPNNQLNENSMLTEGASFGFNNNKMEQISAVETVGSLDGEMFRSSTLSTWAQNKSQAPPEKALPIQSAVSRLKVMWLQRKAQLHKAEGNFDDAMENLQDALALHLGTTDYSKANLSVHAHTNPAELLDYIGDTYVMYDKTAHLEAGRIQRCFLRQFRRRHKMATKIQAFFRAFLVRNADYQSNETKKQCAQIIQRAFRRYYAKLCAFSTRIKRWYRVLKQQEDYKKKLFIYRMARRIQRVFRGNKSREFSWQKKMERWGNLLFQRQARSYNSRRQRTLAIKFYHGMLFRAARTVQRLVRSIQAVRRAQLRLLYELAREEDRASRERDVVNETVKVQIAKTRLYMKTDAGRVHMKYAMQRIRIEDNEFNCKKKTMTQEEIMAREAMVSFELFDSDGSGMIDEEELANMLQEMSVTLNAAEFRDLVKEISGGDDGGEIDFGSFLDWYTGGGGEEAANNATNAQKVFKLVLQARHALMEISGQILYKRAERSILRQATAWLTKDITSTFRNTHPPKFQCCQCLQPFVLFTDYYCHFTEAGMCEVASQKAMFFNKFWVMEDWNRQRQVEHEIMRVNDEIPNINYHAYMASIADISLLQDFGVGAIVSHRTKAAQYMFLEKAASNGDKIDMRKEMFDAVNICQDNFISSMTALMIGERLGFRVPKEWVLDDRWDLAAVNEWLIKIVDGDIASRKGCLMSASKKLKHDCWMVADVYIRVIRLLQVMAEASLVAIIDSRIRRPRRIKLSDKELKREGLDFLSEEQFHESRERIIRRLSILNDEIQKVLVIRIQKRCARKTVDVQVGPDGAITPDALQQILVNEAHVRALASYNSRKRSRVGKAQLKRMSCELWASRRLLRDEFGPDRVKEAELQFFYNRFASADTNDGIDFGDFDIVQYALSIFVRQALADSVQKELDPLGTGLISFSNLLSWISENRHKAHYRLTRDLYNGFVYAYRLAMQSLYRFYAEQTLVSKMRKIARLELDYRTKSVKALLMAAKIPPEKVREYNASVADPEAPAATDHHKHQQKSRPTPVFAPAPVVVDDPATAASAVPAAPGGQYLSELKTIEVLKAEADVMNQKLGVIKKADEDRENLLLYRLAEDKAEIKCKRNFFSLRGVYNLRTEKLIMNATDTIIEAYGHCISPGALYPWTATNKKRLSSSHDALSGKNQRGEAAEEEPYEVGWSLALAVLVYAFDTDCSGTFDEGEVRLLLECAFCALSEKKILYSFPEVRLDSATLDDVVKYLAPRIGWRRGLLHRLGSKGGVFIYKKTSWQASAMLLISNSRQMAREKAAQATALTSSGVLIEDDGDKNDDALMMRSQIFAMRQVHMFLKTSQGQIRLHLARKRVRHWWKEDVWREGFRRRGLLRYACLLHGEWKGILVTELPHLVGYLVAMLKLQTNAQVAQIAEMLAKVKVKEDVHWLSQEEAVALLEPMFVATSDNLSSRTLLGAALVASRSATRDAVVNMNSRARQQAVLVALSFENIFVADTNYRCSVLGLDAILKENRRLGFKRSTILMNWNRVPREATIFLLLSRGYLLDDLELGEIPKWVNIERRQGGLARDKVGVSECLRIAFEETDRVHSLPQAAYRWGRFFMGLPRYLEYKRVARTVTLQKREINERGATFLREIIKGQSHTISGVEDED